MSAWCSALAEGGTTRSARLPGTQSTAPQVQLGPHWPTAGDQASGVSFMCWSLQAFLRVGDPRELLQETEAGRQVCKDSGACPLPSLPLSYLPS